MIKKQFIEINKDVKFNEKNFGLKKKQNMK